MREQKSNRECQNPLQEDLKAYLDGELPAFRRATLEKHVAGCPACQAELAALKELATQLFEALPAAPPLPDALRVRILASLPETSAPRPLLTPFWKRRGPMAAFGGVLAMGCAFLLWLRVPESSKAPQAEMPQVPTGASLSASAPSPTRADAEAQRPQIPQRPLSVSNARAEKASAEKKNKAAIAPSLRAESVNANAETKVAPPSEPINKPAKGQESVALLAPQAIATPASAEPTQARDRSVTDANSSAKDASYDKKDASASPKTELRNTGRAIAEKLPVTYTLTIPEGKRSETLEAIRKLSTELSVTLAREQPDLDMSLAPEGREPLLERLKALGALTETPPATTTVFANPNGFRGAGGFARGGGTQSGFGGGRGGSFGSTGGSFGGGGAPGKPAVAAKAMPQAQPQLRLIVMIKEAEPKKESEPKKLP